MDSSARRLQVSATLPVYVCCSGKSVIIHMIPIFNNNDIEDVLQFHSVKNSFIFCAKLVLFHSIEFHLVHIRPHAGHCL